MQYILFDIEIYKNLDNEADAFIITKYKEETNYFYDPFDFIDYVNLKGRLSKEPLVLVGFNNLSFDFTVLCVWIGLCFDIELSDKQVLSYLKNFVGYWINSTGWAATDSFYQTVARLTPNSDFPDIDVEFITNVIKSYHPFYKGRNMFKVGKTYKAHQELYFFDIRAVHKTGSLKIRSMIEGCDVFVKNRIIDFDHDAPQDTEAMKTYAYADVLATDYLLNHEGSCFSLISTCYETIKTYGMENTVTILDSTLCIKKIAEIPSYFNHLPPQHITKETKHDVPEFIEFEQELSRMTNIDFTAERHYFYKTIKGRKYARYSIPLRNKTTNDLIRGGLHEAEDYTIFETNEDTICFEVDFSSLYPNIMTSELCPVTSEYGKDKIRENIRLREQLKKNKDPKNAVFKLINNSCYGLIPYYTHQLHKSAGGNYVPLHTFSYTTDYVTRLGQVSIIQLVEFLIESFDKIKIGNVNTDGVMVQVTGYTKDEIIKIITQFNNKFTLHSSIVELKFHKNLIIFNTNNYIKINEDLNIEYMGGKLNSVRVNRPNKVAYPIFINCKSIFIKILKSFLDKGVSLTSSKLLTDLELVLPDILKEERVLMYYDDTKLVEIGVRGYIIDTYNIEGNSLTSQNFKISDQPCTDLNFCLNFFSSMISGFFKLDCPKIIEDIKSDHCLSTALRGKDFIRSKSLINNEELPVIFINSIIHKIYNITNFSGYFTKTEGKRATLNKLKFETPLELLDYTINNLSTVLTETQINDHNFKTLMPYIFDFDFKCKTEIEAAQQLSDKRSLVEELKVLYNDYKQFILLIEWNDVTGHLNYPISKNGIHVIILGLLENKDVFKNIKKKYEVYLDKRDKTDNITLYHNYAYRTRNRLGSLDTLQKYMSKLFNFLYPNQEDYTRNLNDDEVIDNAQVSYTFTPNTDIDKLVEGFKNYVDPFTKNGMELTINQQDFIELTLHRCTKRFSYKRTDWFKELGEIKIVLRFLMTSLGFDDQHSYTKTFIQDMLLKLCLNCEATGKSAVGFNLLDTITVCDSQINKTYGEAISNLYSIRSRKYFDVFVDLYNVTGEKFKDLSTSKLYNLTKNLINLFSNISNHPVTQIDSLEESLFENKISFIEAATGIGKTHNIVYLITQNKINNSLYKFLVFCPTLNEIDQLEQRLIDAPFEINIGIYTDKTKKTFEPYEDFDVVLISSAYLSTSLTLPSKLLDFIDYHSEPKEHCSDTFEFISIIDEFDNALSTAALQFPLFSPYNITEQDDYSTLFNDVPKVRLFHALDQYKDSNDENIKMISSFVYKTLDSTYKSTTLSLFEGYRNKNKRGSCLKGCILNKDLNMVYGSYLNSKDYNKIFILDDINLPYKLDMKTKYVIQNGFFFQPTAKTMVLNNLLEAPILETEPLTIYQLSEQAEAYMNDDILKCIGSHTNESYIVKLVRCKFESDMQYVANGDYACGTYLYTKLKVDGFKYVLNMSLSSILLTATKDIKTMNFLSKFNVEYYQLNNKLFKLDNVHLRIFYNRRITNAQKEQYEELDSNVYDVKRLIFVNGSRNIKDFDIDNNDDLTIKGDLGNSLNCNLTEEVDQDGNKILNIPTGDINVISFNKSAISRAITIKAKTIDIEFGNIGRIYDPFFIEHLVLQGDKIKNVGHILSLYNTYNSFNAVTSTIQSMGRVLRGFKNDKTGEINLSGRNINLYISSVDEGYLHFIIANLVKRCNLDTLSITNGLNGEDYKFLAVQNIIE